MRGRNRSIRTAVPNRRSGESDRSMIRLIARSSQTPSGNGNTLQNDIEILVDDLGCGELALRLMPARELIQPR